jgi:hypothetical protein
LGEKVRKRENHKTGGEKKRRTDCCGRFSDFWSFSTASRRPARRRRRSRRQEKDV